MELDELGIDMEAQNCLDQIQQESRISADYDLSQGMTGEELHNFCKFLYSQVQSKDEEISRLTANIKELTDEVRLSRLQQQVYNNENMALGATHSQKLDVVLQQLQETKQELADTKRRLEIAEALLADANEKNHQLEAERKKHAKERKDLEDEIALLRSDLYSGSKSQQSGRSAEEVGANDGRDDFDGTDASLPEENRKGDASSGSTTDGAKSEESENSPSEEPLGSSEGEDSDLWNIETGASGIEGASLGPGSNVNVDETWERFQTHFGHRKTYMWCLVNRKANIVIFFYEDTVDKYGNRKSGGRNRAVLKDFLGDAKLKSLQSDDYICYMYLDDDLIDIEHLCCLAHVRSKLERAERMGCKEASFPMSLVRKLYKREDFYVEKGYDAETIKMMRNDEYPQGIIDQLQNEMFNLMANKMAELPKLMQQALKYLHKFWKQVFAYRNDGEYSIDNMAAERALRPQTLQRKGSLFFASVQGGIEVGNVQYFIQTCKQVGVSFRQYFKALLKAVKSGRTDYENLLPMTISLEW